MPESAQAADQAQTQEQDDAAEESKAKSQTAEHDQDGESDTDDPQALREELEKWRKLSRKNEESAKRNAKAAQSWAEYEDSRKTEEQRAQDERDALIAERDDAKRQAAVFRAITEHGLSAEDLDLLKGIPADQLEERAKKLAARLKPTRTPSPKTGIGRETPPGAGQSSDWLRTALQNK